MPDDAMSVEAGEPAERPIVLCGSLPEQHVARAAQAALARRAAANQVARAARLNADAAGLRRRLITQTKLLRTSLSERRRRLGVAGTIERIEEALERIEADSPPGGPWGVRAQLPRDATCGTVARRLLDEYVHDQLSERAAGDALLVTTELATNAFVHGSGTITLRIERLNDRLRIEVLDEGEPRRIEPGARSSTSEGGRGLGMVDEVSLAWGVVGRTGHVWAEVPVV